MIGRLRDRGADYYRFADAVPNLVERLYINSITGKRNLSRCFTLAIKRTT